MTIKKIFWLSLYYGFAYYLPATNSNYLGKIGGKLRNLCFRKIVKKCGNPINIESHAHFGKGFNIEMGDHSCLGINCHVPNDIIIGDHVMMGPNVYILDNCTHDLSVIPTGGIIPIEGRTIIGNDVWIGRQVLFTPCKTIGNHVVIGAGSVVSNNIPDNIIVAGNPIRFIRNRWDFNSNPEINQKHNGSV